MSRWRKKPVVIEARQLTEETMLELAAWCGASSWSFIDGNMFIPTLEGTHEARAGDWIIQGVQGEFYPCKPDIFAATYEPADGAA